MVTDNPKEAAWLEERKTGIGASEAAAVMNASPYKTQYQLWAEKTGLIEPEDISGKEWIKWGHRLEGVVGEAFAEEAGRSVRRVAPYTLHRHLVHDFMVCTPDALQSRINDPHEEDFGILQIKTAGAFVAKDWADGPPLSYQVQVQHEMEVTGCTWGSLAVLIGGQRLLWFDILRNEKFIAAMIEAEREFWRRVIEKDPPPVDGSPATTEALKKLYPEDDGAVIVLPPEATDWDTRLVAIKAEQKALKDERSLLENQFRAAIGDASRGMLLDGSEYTHKLQTSQHKAKEAYESSFRVLRRRAIK